MSNKFPPGFDTDDRNIAIDFDGVIHTFDKGYHDGTCYGAPIPGSLEAIKQLASKYRIVVFTAKAKPDRPLVNGKTGTELVQEWLDQHGFAPYIHQITAEKPRAIVYIDDNGYRFNNWKETLYFIDEEL